MLKKITGPGLFRLFLALVVFVHHTSRLALGGAAVYVFFCLSGFWIYRMYAGRYSATRQPYFTYIVSRAWRLLPTFWLVTALTLTFYWFNGTFGSYFPSSGRIHAIFSNLFLVGYDSLLKRPVGPGWSLDFEVQFYILAPFIVWFLARRKVPAVLTVLAAAAVSVVSLLAGLQFLVTSQLIFFMLGMTAASVDWRPTGNLSFASLAITSAVIIGCLVSPWRGILLVGAHPGPLWKYTDPTNVALAVMMTPFALYTTRQPGFKSDGMFGDLSYIIYLLHWLGEMSLGSRPGTTMVRFINVGAAWVLVLGSSLLIWKFYDHPINRLRAKWVAGRKAPSASAGLRQHPIESSLAGS
jgi:peptidoglycan/LPS O-acetylase OafA/YrhL